MTSNGSPAGDSKSTQRSVVGDSRRRDNPLVQLTLVRFREFLREPYWPIKAAHALGTASPLPVQYARAFPNQPSKQTQR